MRKEVDIVIEQIRESFRMPEYSDPFDAGADVFAAIEEPIFIHPLDTVIIPLGFKIEIPRGWEVQVRPRSGLSAKTPIRIANSPGTIDARYRDEVGVIITNTSQYRGGFKDVVTIKEAMNTTNLAFDTVLKIMPGDKIAQIVLCESPKMVFCPGKVNDETRGGGFGHSGT